MSFDIDKIADLACIRLKPEEKKKLGGDLAAILKYVEMLEKLDTDGVEPTSHVLDMENVMRADEVRPWDVRDAALKHAPDGEGKFFKVPKVVER